MYPRCQHCDSVCPSLHPPELLDPNCTRDTLVFHGALSANQELDTQDAIDKVICASLSEQYRLQLSK